MKKVLFYLLPAIAMVVLSAGCKEQNWDYPNVEISITLEDSDGNDLLYRASAVFENDITVEYNGEIYELKGGPTRADGPEMPEMKGLRWKAALFVSVPNQILFGEFGVDTRQYHRESFTIDWGDGTRNEIEFDLYSTSNGRKKQPTIHQATWVDGVPSSSNTLNVRIVRD